MTEMTTTAAPLEALAKAVDRLNHVTLADAYRAAGIEPPQQDTAFAWSPVEYTVDAEYTVTAMALDGDRHVFAGQRPIGTPGTYIIDGRIEVEQNSRVKPFQARGRLGRPGLNEEVYRTEPVAFKSINEISALGEHAAYEPVICDTAPQEVVDEIMRQHRAIRCAMFEGDVLANAMPGMLKHGFAFFEVGWGDLKSGKPKVDYLSFREQASVERWIFDDRQANWIGTEFRTASTASAYAGNLAAKTGIDTDATHYIIPNGDTLSTARSMLVNIFATGNNLEGVSPIRVITGLRKLKELILSSFGIGAQKYMVPIATIVQELTDAAADVIAQLGAAAHKAEVQELITRIENLRGRLGAVLPIPAGHRLEFQNPTNQMFDPVPMLQYIDALIALVFSNEGAMLGIGSFGSYAMASTSDAKFARASIVYSGRIAHALTKLLHTGLRLCGVDLDELDELPHYSFRFKGTQDNSRWLADLAMVMNAQPQRWPDDTRHAAAERLGLPRAAFEGLEALAPDGGDGDGAATASGEDVQKQALNGAQVTSMVEVLGQVAAGLLPAESAIRILMRAFQMSREEAAAMVNPAEGFEQPEEEPVNEPLMLDDEDAVLEQNNDEEE